jgi:hypothetical protein
MLRRSGVNYASSTATWRTLEDSAFLPSTMKNKTATMSGRKIRETDRYRNGQREVPTSA